MPSLPCHRHEKALELQAMDKTTQIKAASAGVITSQMESVATYEGINSQLLAELIAAGKVILPYNLLRGSTHREIKPYAVGKGLSIKVNANLGASPEDYCLAAELDKLRVAVDAGAHAVMDLSCGGEIDLVRKRVIEESPVMVGSVPIYNAVAKALSEQREPEDITADEIFAAIEKHAQDGIDFVTVHCGVTQGAVARLKNQGRIADIVSRGGSILAAWMERNDAENPLYAQYDRLLELALRYDLTLSLGDGMRPGCLADGSDRAQLEELIVLGELVKRARAVGVQAMVEGPGHLPLDQIRMNIELQKSLCDDAPFYVLGPLVTDIAPGYDHITSAIGGALAAWAGADFLCYVTPAEHLKLPDAHDVHEGVIAARIAAHAAELALGRQSAWDWDIAMARARKALDWKRQIALAIDPPLAAGLRAKSKQQEGNPCSMCGELCAMRMSERALGKKGTPPVK
jgi:phosphomethylpyrimidine synthase